MRTVSAAGGGGGGRRRDKRLPPGFRFHPTDEELVLYYLKGKICRKRLRLNPIAETDVYKFDPEELPGLSILKTGDRQWFFFSPRGRKYPNGTSRTSRGTRSGYWKATGKDRNITCNSRDVGIKKTLVFYRGRAPNGQRTDWVMHEYTLHDHELNRCQNALDYYALYKVYKKSGPGPKNGEQYGAPFREEEWADEDVDEPTNSLACPVGQLVTTSQLDEVPSADKMAVGSLVQSPLADMEEFLNSILDDGPESNQLHIGCSDYTSSQSQVASEEDTQSAMVYSSSGGINCPNTVRSLIQTDNQCNELANIDFTHMAPPTSHLHEAPVVTSAVNDFEPEFFVPEEDFLEFDDLIGPEPAPSSIEKHSGDFLEFDDLIGIESTFSSVENPVENLTVEDYTGLNELDLYHDAALFLNDMGSVGQEDLSQSCMTFLENNESGEPNYQLQPQFKDVNQSDSQLWGHDQRNYLFASAGTTNGTDNNRTSGVINRSMSSENQDPSQKDGQGSATSQLSSAIWAFLDSIPTTPASAAENVLVNQAFVRMSSFSRLRVNSINNNINIAKKAGGSKKLVLVSIIGIACAISWVLVGNMDIWGRNSSL